MIILLGKEYPTIQVAAEQHNLTRFQLKSRIRMHGKNWPYLFDQIVPARKNPIILQNKEYTSIKAAARQNQIDPSTLKGRIKKYGPNSPLLFKHNRLRNHALVIQGKHFKTISEAAKYYNMSYATLSHRIKVYGSDSKLLFLSSKELQRICGIKSQRNPLTVNGITYESLSEYCRKMHITPDYAKKRFAKYGYNHPILNYNSKVINLNGKYYKDLDDAASKHGITKDTLCTRIHKWGYNDPRLFQSNLISRDVSNNNLTNHIGNAIQKIHEQDLLLPKEVAKKANLSISFIRHVVRDIFNHPENTYSGIQASDIVNVKSDLATKSNTIHCFKKIVLTHIWAYRHNLPDLQIVPQCQTRYYWDDKNENLYSSQGLNNGNLKMLKPRYRTKLPTWRIRTKNYSWDINKNDIHDLLQYPNLTIDDLVTKDQIQRTFNLSQNQFYRYNLNHILKLHKRFDFNTGVHKIGYNKADLYKIKKLLNN